MKPVTATRRNGGRSRRRVHVVIMLAALGLAASDAVFLEARPPVMRFEVEDNNTPATATPLVMSGYGIATGAIGTAGDVDYWSFPAPAASAVVSVLCDTGGVPSAGATSRRVVLSLIEPDGRTVEVDSGDGTGTGGDGTIETSDAAAIGPLILAGGGTYHIRISAVSETDVVSPYRLLVTMTSQVMGEREGNDDVQSAAPIAVSSGIGVRVGAIDAPGDVDYYSVRATAGDVLFFAAGNPDFLFSTVGPDLAVDVLAPDGVTELLSVDAASDGSDGDPATESANFSIPTSGLYFLRVHNPSGTGSRLYYLMAAVRPFSDAVADFDGDNRTDFAVYSSQGLWTILRLTGSFTEVVPWGEPVRDDIPVPADYDGDGLANVAVYRNTTGQWIIRAARGDGSTVIDWGAPWLGDIPVPGDYDGDGKDDVAVYRKSTGDWFIRFAAGGSAWFQWGAPWLDDLPVPADYDGDGLTDVAVYRNATGQWFLAYSGGGAAVVDWGAPWLGDVPVPADYDGDGAADVAVYRKSTGHWFIQYAAGGTAWLPWGDPWNDIPVPGDYDGDGSTNAAIYRPGSGLFYVYRFGAIVQFGPNQVPVNRPVAVR